MLCHRYGRIIVVTSASAILGSPADAAYISAKAGLGSLARALAREFAKRLRVF
jgi:NAD(P)-dependent dehydrogenase (short-subunit alcohol dehydrogenase family)